jgi:glycosyltransferase involved in cell wall biosynthesis
LIFHVFGDGSQRHELERQAKILGLNNSLIFHGHRREIHACIASLDVLVICSEHEGLPMTALESLALGTPIIAHRVGGLIDVLEKNQGNILLSKNDPSCYVREIRRMLLSSLESFNCEKPSSIKLQQMYSAEYNAALMKKMYSDL